MHKNEMASQRVLRLKDLAPGVQTLDSVIHLARKIETPTKLEHQKHFGNVFCVQSV